MPDRITQLLFLFVLGISLPAAANKIIAGPMAGFSAMRSVTIWLQADAPGQAQLEYWNSEYPTQRVLSAITPLLAEEDNAGKIVLNSLEPGILYRYRVILDASAVTTLSDLKFRTQTLWQWRAAPPNFTALMGSCAYINDAPYDRPGQPYGGGYEIFSSMAKRNADVMLWLGDNVYFREADHSSPWGMSYRYRKDRALPELQALLRTGHHFAIWDDHDYGPNDSNRSFIFKENSLNLFKRYWANPSFGLPDVPGVFTKVSFSDVDFFLLDDRYYRDSDHAQNSNEKVMFGPEQMKWLRNALLESSATFKVIAAGGEMLNEFGTKEGWRHFPEEKNTFLEWLLRSKISGVLFLSGDRHLTALTKLTRKSAYPLYELTCSPLTSGPRTGEKELAQPNLVAGTVVGERNFCELEFEGKKAKRLVTIRSFNAKGELMWAKKISAAELSGKIKQH